MSIKKIKTFTNIWLSGHEITIEADTNQALPTIEIIWLPDASIKESKERIRATFRNLHIELPKQKIILNLAPSHIKKIWTNFDLPMAIAILLIIKWEYIQDKKWISNSLFFWELGLDGEIKRVNWLLPSIISAINKGYDTFFIPKENSHELEYIPNINVFPIQHFQEILNHFLYEKTITQLPKNKNIKFLTQNHEFESDFWHIKWHLIAKRAATIAAAGMHNILFIGPPWSWKTMLSKSMQSILPPLNFNEILEISQMYSLVGKLSKSQPLITKRPFRQIHHTASQIAIVGGGRTLTPWEVSLAHHGILFFDELTEFPREVLEVLRQPLEDKKITISRVSGSVLYPANFMFVASMNPCKCGFYKDNEKQCHCSLTSIQKYQAKISWPLLDRIDMIIEVQRENIDKLLEFNIQEENSKSLQQKVLKAREKQQKRYQNTKISNNAGISAKHINEFIPLNTETKEFLHKMADKLELSWRVIHRIMKIARTIADMNDKDQINTQHLAEALQYRSKSMFLWNI